MYLKNIIVIFLGRIYVVTCDDEFYFTYIHIYFYVIAHQRYSKHEELYLGYCKVSLSEGVVSCSGSLDSSVGLIKIYKNYRYFLYNSTHY